MHVLHVRQQFLTSWAAPWLSPACAVGSAAGKKVSYLAQNPVIWGQVRMSAVLLLMNWNSSRGAVKVCGKTQWLWRQLCQVQCGTPPAVQGMAARVVLHWQLLHSLQQRLGLTCTIVFYLLIHPLQQQKPCWPHSSSRLVSYTRRILTEPSNLGKYPSNKTISSQMDNSISRIWLIYVAEQSLDSRQWKNQDAQERPAVSFAPFPSFTY